ncbi:FERM and PDZ domain-containing protein 3 [Segatella maculosa]|uniref:DUF7833 domain-containing protein n=1 Tax=Segatella maculosa TaxID=439703 RepID=UPI0023F47B93|nr:FERM and PDZ domain-containing protein 3 [Segatella maculosa]
MENKNTQRVGTTARRNRTTNSKAPFIRLEIAMLNSYDMILVRRKYGLEGWGIVLFMMKYLIECHTDCRAPLYVAGEIARLCRKNKKTILQIIYDFPALFEIEPGGQIFSSPYLMRFIGKCGVKNEQTNGVLRKLTNETLDNQAVESPKRNDQEKRKDEEKEVEKSAVVTDSSVDKTISEDAEAVDADVVVEEKVAEDTKAVAVANASVDKTAATPRRAVPKAASKAPATAVRAPSPQSVAPASQATPPADVATPSPDTTAQPDEGVPRELLALLYADNSYMASLEHMVDLAVHANLFVRRNLLLWFQGYCRMHAKRIRSASDAKDYLANLLRPGSNTRAQFMAYQNRIYERQR